MRSPNKLRKLLSKKNNLPHIKINFEIISSSDNEPFKPPPNPTKRIWKKITRFSVIIAIIGGLILIGEYLKDQLKSNEEKYKEANIIEGNIYSPKIGKYLHLELNPSIINQPIINGLPIFKGLHIPGLRKMPAIYIRIGDHIIIAPVLDLYTGIEVFGLNFVDCGQLKLNLLAKDDRLYVSTKFIDLESNHEVGNIEYNHWSIYKSEILDYPEQDPDEQTLEVRDKHGSIVFQMSFKQEEKDANFLSLAGYFVSPTSVLILNNPEMFNHNHYVPEHENECISKNHSNWKQESLVQIEKIRSLFKKD